jgi:hypothetical protein
MEDKKLKLEGAVRDMLEGVKMSEVETKYGINAGTLSTLKKGAEIAIKLKVNNNEVETTAESCNCNARIVELEKTIKETKSEMTKALLQVFD